MMVSRPVGRGVVALAALSAVATLAVIANSHSRGRVSLATAAELREITWAESSDMNPSNLAAKNDDGHTRMWNAAGNLVKREHHSRKQAVSDQGRSFYGMPKFFAHSTGYVQDYVSKRDGFGLPARKAVPVKLQAPVTQMLLQLPAADKAKALAAVSAWETKELRKSFADPRESQLAVKQAEAKTWSKKARTQQLFNAAHNDEITAQNIGHMHPSEMTELRRMAPEYKAIEKTHHVTSATDMNYQPLRWMHEQGEPGAVKARKAGLKVASARTQMLWNAGADDSVGGSQSSDDDDDKGFSPRQWLASQHDDAEMRETAPQPMPGYKRVFREDADHARNFEGSYVTDNSIGLQVDNLKAPETMLAMTDAQQYKGAEQEHADAREAYLKKHKRQADIAKQHGAATADAKDDATPKKAANVDAKAEKELTEISKQEKSGMHALKKLDTLSSGEQIAAAERKQAEGRIAYLAHHARAADLATDGKASAMEASAKPDAKGGAMKTPKMTSLEEAEEAKEEAKEGEAADENAEVKKELDDLKAMATDAVGNLPDSAPASIRAIAKGDYATLMAYLDQVAADATRVQHGDAVPAGEGDAAAKKATPSSLKDVKFTSLRTHGSVEVALALDQAVRTPLRKVAEELNNAANDEERTNIVLQGLAEARINALEILEMPQASFMAAKEDLKNAEKAEIYRKEAEIARQYVDLRKAEEIEAERAETARQERFPSFKKLLFDDKKKAGTQMLEMPSQAENEDLLNAQEEEAARNEMIGIPRWTPPVDKIRAFPVVMV